MLCYAMRCPCDATRFGHVFCWRRIKIIFCRRLHNNKLLLSGGDTSIDLFFANATIPTTQHRVFQREGLLSVSRLLMPTSSSQPIPSISINRCQIAMDAHALLAHVMPSRVDMGPSSVSEMNCFQPSPQQGREKKAVIVQSPL